MADHPIRQYPDERREKAETDMLRILPPAASEAVRQMDTDTTQPRTGLVVQPYREHGVEKWVFRCWGTDTCDGWLGLGHHTQQSAERERDRHLAEDHKEQRLVSDDEATMPAGAPTPDWQYPLEECPHCDDRPYANRMDEHLATVHADIPPCTATLDNEHTSGTLPCVLRTGHQSWYHAPGYWHVSAHGPVGRTVWNDTATGATPHKENTDG